MKTAEDVKKITIAIDGHSSCGKSTLAKEIAKQLSYIYIDSGAMYRGVALYSLRNNWVSSNHLDSDTIIAHLKEIELTFQFDETLGKPALYLNGEHVEKLIRSMEVSSVVSPIATIKEVRQKLVEEQRKMSLKGGVVMDGRDIGSVVFPHAELKIFLTARPDVRAKRRYDEIKNTDSNVDLEEIKKNLLERDHIDSTREESPLIQTADAWVLDNSDLTKIQQLELVLNRIDEISK
ncbi:MAG: (d)CMP kinase [Crocinitomicaceae bacterium]